MKLASARDVSAVLKLLREKHPLNRRLRVRVIPMAGHGSTCMNDFERLITISLREQDNASEQVNYLIHEYAHAMEYDKLGIHSKLWGQLHSKIYTTWVQNF